MSVLATVASVLPAFLTGALAVQLRDELDLDATGLGLAVAAFFAVGVVGSAVLGHLTERLGARRALTISLTITTVADLLLATLAHDWVTLALPLMLAGSANALSAPDGSPVRVTTTVFTLSSGGASANSNNARIAAAGGGLHVDISAQDPEGFKALLLSSMSPSFKCTADDLDDLVDP